MAMRKSRVIVSGLGETYSSIFIIWRFRGGVPCSTNSDLMRRFPEPASTFSFSETFSSTVSRPCAGLRLLLVLLPCSRFEWERRCFLGEGLNGRSFLTAHSISIILDEIVHWLQS